MLEIARAHRLTRNQHVLFRIGELVARAEGAGALARRAARAADGDLSPKADSRFDAAALAAISRVNARDAAHRVGGRRAALDARCRQLPVSSTPPRPPHRPRFDAVTRAQAGLVDDMSEVASDLCAHLPHGR